MIDPGPDQHVEADTERLSKRTMDSSALITAGAELPTQSFIGSTRPQPALFDPIENRDDGIIKPDGGLWTSSVKDGEPCAWLQWCRAEHFGLSDETRCWWLDPDPEARVLVIDSETDTTRILDAYERTDDVGGVGRMFAAFDYEAMADDYDGLRLTSTGQRETRFSKPGMYGYDCESTIWFDWVFTSVTDGGPVAVDAGSVV